MLASGLAQNQAAASIAVSGRATMSAAVIEQNQSIQSAYAAAGGVVSGVGLAQNRVIEAGIISTQCSISSAAIAQSQLIQQPHLISGGVIFSRAFSQPQSAQPASLYSLPIAAVLGLEQAQAIGLAGLGLVPESYSMTINAVSRRLSINVTGAAQTIKQFSRRVGLRAVSRSITLH